MSPSAFLEVFLDNRTVFPHQRDPNRINPFGGERIHGVPSDRELLGKRREYTSAKYDNGYEVFS